MGAIDFLPVWVAAQMYFLVRMKRVVWEDHGAGRSEVLPLDEVPPEWMQTFRRDEAALAACGFRLAFVSHNARFTERNARNSSAMFSSPDGSTTLVHAFIYFPNTIFYFFSPRLFSRCLSLQEAWIAQSKMEDDSIVVSWPTAAPRRAKPYSWQHDFYFPEATEPCALAAAHLQVIAEQERTGRKAVRFQTPAAMMADSNQQRHDASTWQLAEVQKWGGLGALKF